MTDDTFKIAAALGASLFFALSALRPSDEGYARFVASLLAGVWLFLAIAFLLTVRV